jgi:CMP-2-keto-3-deoxyoctulosonic acid synthetase
LEQLRVLYSGDKIAVGRISHSAPGIDTAEDYAAFVRRQTS